jgi:hypothetical protein
MKQFSGALSSPTGRTLLISSGPTQFNQKRNWAWVDTGSLTIVVSWEGTASGFRAISDESIVESTCLLGHEFDSRAPCSPMIRIRSLYTDWKTIAPSEPGLRPQFVNDDTIFIPYRVGKLWGVKLLGTDGKILFEEPEGHSLGRCYSDSFAYPSENGRRLVIPACEWKGAVAALDIGAHPILKQILVYDLGPVVHTHVLDVKGPTLANEMNFAISPDGSKFAVMVQRSQTVELFKLPPVQ